MLCSGLFSSLESGRTLHHSQEKLNYFWIVEKKKIEDAKAQLRNKEREAQDLEEKHQVEIKVSARPRLPSSTVVITAC